jgi:aryl-alcohol dehydrogenase-like predicted oxidoreductase
MNSRKMVCPMYSDIKAQMLIADTELGCKVQHLALAWVARQPQTSTVILGASRPEQVIDNLKALEVTALQGYAAASDMFCRSSQSLLQQS